MLAIPISYEWVMDLALLLLLYHPSSMKRKCGGIAKDGVAVFLRPGGVPVWFDHESVTQIVGDIADTSA